MFYCYTFSIIVHTRKYLALPHPLVAKVVVRNDQIIENTTSNTSTPTQVVYMHKIL